MKISWFISLYSSYRAAIHGAMAQACDCKRDRFCVRFPREEMIYLIFSFFRSGVEAKRGFEFRHTTHRLHNSEKSGNEQQTRFPLPTLL